MKKMKGVILGGGLGTRLRPLTNTRNKHTLLIAGRPMIEYPIVRLVCEGITDIAICLNGPYGHQVEEVVGDGQDLKCKVQYFYDKNNVVGGPGYSLAEASEWCERDNGDIVVLFGDGIFFSPLGLMEHRGPHMLLMNLPPGGADDPSKYAQARVEGERVLELVEKPKQLVSTLVQAGAFIFPPSVFSVIDQIKRKTPPGCEIGMTEINQWYASKGSLTFTRINQGDYIDCGTPDALREAEERVELLRIQQKYRHLGCNF